MITQWKISIRSDPAHPLYADSAYRLYAFLLEQLSAEEAELLHQAHGEALSQFLYDQRECGTYLWTLNLFAREVAEILSPVLTALTEVKVENTALPVTARTCREITAEQLILSGRGQLQRACTWELRSPAAFKQGGRYAIFPQERLLLQSLVNRWNVVFPEYPLEDEDAFQAMLSGLHIVDYRLRTTRFPLKGVKIPSFIGSITIEAKLPVPLLELWLTLTRFADFSGIGIKTSLGMGGVCLRCAFSAQSPAGSQ